MVSNLVYLAKKHLKEHNWAKAIEYFEQYMNQINYQCDDGIYVSYAKCLRIVGETERAKKVLTEGRTLHPGSENILRELFNLYDILGDWKAAENAANTLIEMNPNQANYHFLLGRVYAFLSEDKRAEQVFKTGLKYKHKMPFDSLIRIVQQSITDNTAKVSSQYIFTMGRNNLGGFIHF